MHSPSPLNLNAFEHFLEFRFVPNFEERKNEQICHPFYSENPEQSGRILKRTRQKQIASDPRR